MQLPEKRSVIGYWHIKPTNKAWVEKQAKMLSMTQASVMDHFIDHLRETYVTYERRPVIRRRRSKVA